MDLQHKFSQGNGPRIFELRQELCITRVNIHIKSSKGLAQHLKKKFFSQNPLDLDSKMNLNAVARQKRKIQDLTWAEHQYKRILSMNQHAMITNMAYSLLLLREV